MAAQIDIETHLLAIQAYLSANLNTYISAINSEKNDSISLQSISSSAYFLQTLNDTVANYNPHILIALENIVSTGIGPATGKSLTFAVVLILEDRGQDLYIGRRMLRYGRVLENLFNEGFAKILPSASFKVNSLVPIAMTAINSNDPFRAVGVEIVASLA